MKQRCKAIGSLKVIARSHYRSLYGLLAARRNWSQEKLTYWARSHSLDLKLECYGFRYALSGALIPVDSGLVKVACLVHWNSGPSLHRGWRCLLRSLSYVYRFCLLYNLWQWGGQQQKSIFCAFHLVLHVLELWCGDRSHPADLTVQRYNE